MNHLGDPDLNKTKKKTTKTCLNNQENLNTVYFILRNFSFLKDGIGVVGIPIFDAEMFSDE